MPKKRQQRPYIFGRVFFPGEENPVLDEVRLQPLGNHVGNVRRLVKQWEDFPCKDSLSRVLKAADIHDMGKPQRFSIQVNTDTKGRFKNYIYSFRGHRFLAECDNAWVQALARGHHDFSVGDITRDAYQLRKESNYAAILNQNPLAYAEELYILEMCDQIEAELACRILGDEKQAESRTFMDYTISEEEGKARSYLLDPWPFKVPQLDLQFYYWSKQLTNAEKAELQKICDRNQDSKLGASLDNIIKTWWHQQIQNPTAYKITATLKPAFQEKIASPNSEHIYKQLAGFSPNPMQDEVFHAIVKSDTPALLVKGPTGTGKTEAVLFPALAKGYRLFLPLPARSLLEDQKDRIQKYLLRFSELPENHNREVSLVVDTGSQMYRWIYQNGKDITNNLRINLRRHLYKGDVILTTLDKFLYRYFSFGDKQKSFIFPLRIHRSKTLICFDEAHSYDDISFTNFQSLVRALYEAGRSLILMTATMPNELLAYFDYLGEPIDYVDDESRVQRLQQYQAQTLNRPYLNQRSFEWRRDVSVEDTESFQVSFAKIIKEEWQEQPSRRILAVVQTVRDAAEIYQWLKADIEDHLGESKIFLYHGRLADQERPNVYQAIQKQDKDQKPYILITTSAIEVGCDLNSETLISQICPPENLIQRAGRCNRRGDVLNAKVILIGDHIPEFANSLNEDGWKTYQSILQNLGIFDAQKIGACISRPDQLDDYRVVEIFSILHDYVYQTDLTCQPSYEKGLVITRSWTPSATIFYDDGTQGDWDKNFSKFPKVSVPLDRLLIKKEDGMTTNQYANIDVYERVYDQETTRWIMTPLRWGSAYSKDIVIRIGAARDEAMADALEPYIYKPEIGFVNLPGIFTRIRSNLDEKLLYQPSETQQRKSVIISYVKPLEKQLTLAI